MLRFRSLCLALILGMFAASAARAATVVTIDNGQLAQFTTIHFDVPGPALTVVGFVNGTSPHVLVDFMAVESILGSEGTGQATIVGVDGTFRYLDIKMADPKISFTGFDFSLYFADTLPDFFVSALYKGDVLGSAVFTAKNGQNRVRVEATGPLDEIQIDGGADQISTFKQPRIGGVMVPVPASLWGGLSLLGLLGIKRFARR